ncbi:MAG: 2-oxo acid dehydrogenase subunit E2 [Actinobacteria bacterium]|nr:2-oxo acid dehydrogenase subunit E2 [Actinomycetota bacterium]
MATPFKMPQLGETVAEGTITRWLKKEGESVQADEPLVEVSTDKVDSEIPAPSAGVVLKILAQEGDTVAVGETIAEIGEAGASAAPSTSQTGDVDAAPSQEPPVSQESPATSASAPAPEPEAPSEVRETVTTPDRGAESEERAPAAAASDGVGEPRRGILSPLVRKLAAEHEVDLDAVRGTGTGGRITKQDIMAAIGSASAQAAFPSAAAGTATAAATGPAAAASTSGEVPATSSPVPATAPATSPAQAEAAPRPAVAQRPPTAGGDEVIAVSNMRKSIAEHMVTSLHETARAWNTIEVDMTRISHLRQKAGAAFKQSEGYSLTWMPFVSKAVTQVLQKYPQVNATWNGDGTITRKHYVNLGVAVALENGLIVPVLKGADGMNLVGLARGVRDLAQRARTKKLMPDDVQGGTFTITNPGPFGSILSVPIINRGQAAILAFDAVVKRPVVVTDENGDDSIAIRQMVFLSLSWDHRVIDGAEAAQFLASLKQTLEDGDFSGDLVSYLPNG